LLASFQILRSRQTGWLLQILILIGSRDRRGDDLPVKKKMPGVPGICCRSIIAEQTRFERQTAEEQIFLVARVSSALG
jgi:hypothetical protein